MSMDFLLLRNLPNFSSETTRRVVASHYGIEGTCKQLASERELSWRIEGTDGRDVVVKISNVSEPEGVVDMQVKALNHIFERDPALPVPRVVPSLAGAPYEWIEDGHGSRHMIRVLTFLTGEVVERVEEAFSAGTRFNIGAMVGRLAYALRDFFHPYACSNVHLWDISRALALRPQIVKISDVRLRQLCSEIFDRAERFTLPQLLKTRRQVVHQDSHGGNILVDPNDDTSPVGIIDFGDMGYNSIVADIVAASETFSKFDEDPIAYLCDVTSGFDSTYPLEENEIDLVFDAMLLRIAMATVIVEGREATDESGIPHIEDASHYPRMMELLSRQGRAQAVRRLRQACRFPVYGASSNDAEHLARDYDVLRHEREAHLGPIWHFYKKPLHITRADGAWMYAADGTAYLDVYNNVAQIGHCHPHVAKAIYRQTRALNTNTRYMCDVAVEYAARLAADLPDHLDTCIFVNSGSEANDLAMQIAMSLSRHDGGLIIDQAYHGCTELTTALSNESWRHLPADEHPKRIDTVMVPDMYRGPFANDPQAAAKYAADADRAIAALDERGHKPAAFMVDTALCSSGVLRAPENYFNLVAEKVRSAGGFVIADEVQAGCGRMGTFWGFRANGLKDDNIDFITMGKPVGNGHPLGVVILGSALIKRFLNGTYPLLFSTFGGNTVACAAGMAVLDVIERENLIDRSAVIGDYLRQELRRLAERHAIIGDIRGLGMMTGVELVTDRLTKEPAVKQTDRLVEDMLARNILIGKGTSNTLKLRPPLIWSRNEVDIFISAFDGSLSM
ncbi:aminotransferase class III-fold pyridoxal phosphate-dependent enzyme [Mesorhizobium sp.]|uniref:aminotransferase class III-fold pyridoxal phosphate-dependent enzyme n=1 Tax=Mesorhizobium sp. TaxID=1871066 RepID=UPI000FE53F82|nr:aminotransferase class III-fold pyridoxal phosphate-dependent enzyme [Mesorhizobium sp.]RWK43679.1 MAG: aminotransferase class III-fold pyridoxal phosphate-dependent enzyme [Mesorhizobium sp.]